MISSSLCGCVFDPDGEEMIQILTRLAFVHQIKIYEVFRIKKYWKYLYGMLTSKLIFTQKTVYLPLFVQLLVKATELKNKTKHDHLAPWSSSVYDNDIIRLCSLWTNKKNKTRKQEVVFNCSSLDSTFWSFVRLKFMILLSCILQILQIMFLFVVVVVAKTKAVSSSSNSLKTSVQTRTLIRNCSVHSVNVNKKLFGSIVLLVHGANNK